MHVLRKSGVALQGRLTLLLGPPGSGKTTLLKALAGKLQGKSPRVSGRITYNGETFDRFIPQRTAAYVSQVCCGCTEMILLRSFQAWMQFNTSLHVVLPPEAQMVNEVDMIVTINASLFGCSWATVLSPTDMQLLCFLHLH